jgi:uncharacterized membrane protein (DUF2068 family)
MKQDRHLATAVCSWRGHVLPGARVRTLQNPPWLGIDLPVGETRGSDDAMWRLVRCLRCDAWMAMDVPTEPEADTVGPVDRIVLPARGRELRSLLIVRLIAIERAVHCVFFALVVLLAVLLRTELSGVQSWVRQLLEDLSSNSSRAGNLLGSDFVVKEGQHVLALKPSTLNWIIAGALAYCVLEGVEAVGLWHGRRWAEYLTVVATAGFLPLEIHELLKGVSVLKLGAFVVNLVVVVYLLWSKKLFGLGRFRKPRSDEQPLTAAGLLASPRQGLSPPTVPSILPTEIAGDLATGGRGRG